MPLIRKLRSLRHLPAMPARSRVELVRDSWIGPARNDADVATVREAVLQWLGAAQDHSRHADGGFARHFDLVDGWSSSYPETTGYIVPTLLELAESLGRHDLEVRARRALDWLVAIQRPDGGFQGGLIDSTPVVSVTFNTGQILLGLAAGAGRWPARYLEPMLRAATWLRDSQDADGAWRRHPTPFAAPGEKVYETHVAWGLLEADAVAPSMGFSDAAMRNIEWALSRQHHNGWFSDCCLERATAPLTHTIGYALRGIVAGWSHRGDPRLRDAALLTARALVRVQRRDGSLPGRLDADWQATVDWSCMTGNVQVAESWALLARGTPEDDTLRAAAERATRFVRRSIVVDGPPGIVGGVKGSYPVDGDYGHLRYLNWAAKFYLDAERSLADVGAVTPEAVAAGPPVSPAA